MTNAPLNILRKLISMKVGGNISEAKIQITSYLGRTIRLVKQLLEEPQQRRVRHGLIHMEFPRLLQEEVLQRQRNRRNPIANPTLGILSVRHKEQPP